MACTLVVALGLEWDDLGPEKAALASVGAELISLDELQPPQVPTVVALLSYGARVTADDLRRYPNLRAVSELGTGYDGIDIGAAGRLGITVTNVPGYCTEEVADHTLALGLSLVRRLEPLAREVQAGHWTAIDTGSVRRSQDSTWGVIGFGRIGQAVARRASAFGFSVCASDLYLADEDIAAHEVRSVELEELLAEADVVSIHAARTGEDDQMLDRRRLSLLKPTAYLINVARGAFIDEDALADALDAGMLAGAALDVMSDEPPDPSNRLLRHPRVLVTPHSAWYSDQAEVELRTRGIGAIVDVLGGRQPADPVPELANAQPRGLP